MGFLSTKKKVAEMEEDSAAGRTDVRQSKNSTPSLRQVAMKKRPQQWSTSKKTEKKKSTSLVSKKCSSSTPPVAAEYKFEESSPQLELKKLDDDLNIDSTNREKCDSSASAGASSTWVLVSRIFGGGSSSS
mmetsp:Transcript_2677/g.5774  ORF Transcript_2677/g.5774 Transcript_2677/m.5774 type:complete len:131 (+) Transcript_2677:132-524(+)